MCVTVGGVGYDPVRAVVFAPVCLLQGYAVVDVYNEQVGECLGVSFDVASARSFVAFLPPNAL